MIDTTCHTSLVQYEVEERGGMMGFKTLLGMAEVVPDARHMILNAESEGERVDIIGSIRQVEKGLADERRLAMTEIENGAHGELFKVEQGNVTNRTYNSTSLLAKFADRYDKGLLETIGILKNLGVIDIEWNWTPFKAEARLNNLEYSTIQREVVDGDEFDVGEVTKLGYPSFKTINKED